MVHPREGVRVCCHSSAGVVLAFRPDGGSTGLLLQKILKPTHMRSLTAQVVKLGGSIDGFLDRHPTVFHKVCLRGPNSVRSTLCTPVTPPPFVQATPMSKQHWALVPSIFAPLILAVRFSIGPTVCHVCFVIPWF